MINMLKRNKKDWFLDFAEVEEEYRDELVEIQRFESKAEAAKALANAQFRHWSRIGRLLELSERDGYRFEYNTGTGYWHGTSIS